MRPNILFLCSDQHQAAASGCYGHTEVHTPNIDKLARTGIRFDRAYCQSPVCVPSRGSIITGVYPHTHGARILQDALPTDTYTIAHHFKNHGYQTAAIGKMHFVDETQKHGYDDRLHMEDFRKTLPEEEWKAFRKDQSGSFTGRPSKLSARYFQDTFYAEETIRYLEEKRNPDRPFLLWSSYFMPHTPLVPLQSFYDLYDPETLSLPERSDNALETGFEGHFIRAQQRGWYQQSDDDLRKSIAGYYGNTSQMDDNLGRVLNTLYDLGLAENTIIVYTSDHGEMAGAHRMWTKHNMYEQSVRVPLIVSLPNGTNANTSQSHLIEQVDLFPTLAEFCHLPKPENIHGKSFAPLLLNQAYQPREFVYSEYDFCHGVFTQDNRYVGKSPILMVRTDRWKLNYLSWERSELFDLENDPEEFTNVIDEPGNAGIVKELTELANRMYDL
ncbi:MAG: sulfatase-like hydrolase/transferase [bacterium]|nr:sulfatase-like hydrolase/transferase [bacterium]